MSNFIKQIFEQIIPTSLAIGSRKQINRKIDEIKSVEESYKDSDYDKEKVIEELNEYLKACREERDIVENKAKSGLLILTVTMVFITGVVTNKDKIIGEGFLGHLFLLFTIIAILYFIFAVVHILQCLNISEYYSVTLSDKFSQDKKEFSYNKVESLQTIKSLYKYIRINQLININKKNYLFTSFINIRNGVIVIGIIFIFNLIIYPRGQENDKKVENNIFRYSIFNKTDSTLNDSTIKKIPYINDSTIKHSLKSKDSSNKK